MGDEYSFTMLLMLVIGTGGLWIFAIICLYLSEKESFFAPLFGWVGQICLISAFVLTCFTVLYAIPLLMLVLLAAVALAVIVMITKACLWAIKQLIPLLRQRR